MIRARWLVVMLAIVVAGLIFCYYGVVTIYGQTAAQVAAVPIRPDPVLTPGATLPVTLTQLCTPGYTKTVRNVPQALRMQVFIEYHLTPVAGQFEIDHLISLELGGSNDRTNLWPQSYLTTPYNAHTKDTLENVLHRLVCTNKLPLTHAQYLIQTDWIAAYEQFIVPAPRVGPTRPGAP